MFSGEIDANIILAHLSYDIMLCLLEKSTKSRSKGKQ